MVQYGKNRIGRETQIFDPVHLGFPPRYLLHEEQFDGCTIGNNGIIRPGTTIYADVTIGDYFSSGHNVLVREKTSIGDHVSLGTNVIIEGNCILGDHVNLQSLVYIPTNSLLGSHIFIGPNTILTNDKYPPGGGDTLQGPVLEDNCSIGANATILPGVTIGRGSLVAAGSIVTRDVPPASLAIGAPARIKKLPPGAKRL
jgi:acetyltransferase-like isoleucine patch superfamily enzyme